MIKRIIKTTVFFSLPISLLILILESIIQFKFSFFYSLAFILGVLSGMLNLLITDFGLNQLEFSNVSRPKTYYGLLHVLKIVIYGVVLYFSTKLLGLYTSFLCTFGMVFNKIIIYYINLIKIPKEDKKREVEELDIPLEVIKKLKQNNINKVDELTNVSRKKLLEFLNNDEVEMLIKSLKKYELFIKGELEAIIDNDNDV